MSRRPYIREVSATGWWLQQARYVRYMLREISSLFIGCYVLVLIVGLLQLARGEAAYEGYRSALTGTAGTLLGLLTLLFALYHSYTWFRVTPKAMPLMLRGKRVPGVIIIAAHWFGFLVLAAVMCWLVTR